MSYLNSIPITKDIEAEATFEINLLDIISNHVDSLDDLKEIVESVSDYIYDELKEEISAEKQEGTDIDLVDHICNAEQDDIIEVLHSVLSQHPRALHQFVSSKHSDIKLSMIESSQALISELNDFF